MHPFLLRLSRVQVDVVRLEVSCLLAIVYTLLIADGLQAQAVPTGSLATPTELLDNAGASPAGNLAFGSRSRLTERENLNRPPVASDEQHLEACEAAESKLQAARKDVLQLRDKFKQTLDRFDMIKEELSKARGEAERLEGELKTARKRVEELNGVVAALQTSPPESRPTLVCGPGGEGQWLADDLKHAMRQRDDALEKLSQTSQGLHGLARKLVLMEVNDASACTNIKITGASRADDPLILQVVVPPRSNIASLKEKLHQRFAMPEANQLQIDVGFSECGIRIDEWLIDSGGTEQPVGLPFPKDSEEWIMRLPSFEDCQSLGDRLLASKTFLAHFRAAGFKRIAFWVRNGQIPGLCTQLQNEAWSVYFNFEPGTHALVITKRGQ
jgi:hypothetical protein